MEGVGEGKLYFPLLKSAKRQKSPLRQSVSTNVVAHFRTSKMNKPKRYSNKLFFKQFLQSYPDCLYLIVLHYLEERLRLELRYTNNSCAFQQSTRQRCHLSKSVKKGQQPKNDWVFVQQIKTFMKGNRCICNQIKMSEHDSFRSTRCSTGVG